MAEAKLVQDLADRALVIDYAEALGDEVLKVDPPPAHDPMQGPIRSDLDQLSQFTLLLGREARRMALGPDVLQPRRAALVEAVDPIAQGLAIHAADACRLGPAHPVEDGREGQQASALVGILRRCRKAAKLTG